MKTLKLSVLAYKLKASLLRNTQLEIENIKRFEHIKYIKFNMKKFIKSKFIESERHMNAIFANNIAIRFIICTAGGCKAHVFLMQ